MGGGSGITGFGGRIGSRGTGLLGGGLLGGSVFMMDGGASPSCTHNPKSVSEVDTGRCFTHPIPLVHRANKIMYLCQYNDKKDWVGKVSHTTYLLSNIVIDQAVWARCARWEGRFEEWELGKFRVPHAPGKLKVVPISKNAGKGTHSDVKNGHSHESNWRKCVGNHSEW